MIIDGPLAMRSRCIPLVIVEGLARSGEKEHPRLGVRVCMIDGHRSCSVLRSALRVRSVMHWVGRVLSGPPSLLLRSTYCFTFAVTDMFVTPQKPETYVEIMTRTYHWEE